ncbi:alpha/beta hydrolase family protein [Sanyastnella coralliicola]|uniref:alpha/beta hydrolase family protein n=1 Tax=Sanyastnella coralliicola TaxID=3069118 RepID=UPI0027B9F862|nr:alpha/beta hydrolase [Longitalea sp. SCSIO 12813]
MKSNLMRSLLTLLVLGLTFSSANAQDITGFWNGKASLMGQVIRAEFIIQGNDDALKGKFQSPDQGGGSTPITDGHFRNDSLVLEVEQLKLTFEGVYMKELNQIAGRMLQQGQEYPIILQREQLQKEEARRPQEPLPPYPYAMVESEFKTPTAGYTLKGTQYRPYNDIKAAVILISGSGPQDRNSELLGHKPFLVWADHLARQGISSLRYDERGIGESEGNFAMATSRDFAEDALAALRWLRTQEGYENVPIGLMGHSEGGLVAAIAAAGNDEVDFVVSLAGLGVSGKEVLVTQAADIAIAEGMTLEAAIETQEVMENHTNIVIEAKGDSVLIRKNLTEYTEERLKGQATGMPGEDMVKLICDQFSQRWMIELIELDARTFYEQVTCPILAINGDKDVQVDFGNNLRSIEFAARRANNEDVTTVTLKNHNHLLQESESGAVSQYGSIEQTVSPQALNTVSEWINARYGTE